MKTKSQKNQLLLMGSFTLLTSSNVLHFSVSALAAQSLHHNPALATLPLFVVMVVSTLFSYPFSQVMYRWGRIQGFALAAVLGALAGGLDAWAMAQHSFALLLAGSVVLGLSYTAFPFYRFAALETAESGKGARAMGLVMLGGVAGAILGPTLSKYTKELYEISFLGSFLCFAGLQAAMLGFLAWVRLPPMPRPEPHHEKVSLFEILEDPGVSLSMLAAIVANSLMVFLMMALPMAMHDAKIAFAGLTMAVQWHMLGMYAPGFATGPLIERWGKLPVLFVGGALNLLSIGLALADLGFWGYFYSMLSLGVGWNLMYLAATSLFDSSLRPEHKAKAQGLSEFLNLGAASLATLGSGIAYSAIGFQGIAWVSLPVLLAALLMAGLVGRRLNPSTVMVD